MTENEHAARLTSYTICFVVFCLMLAALGGCWMNNYYDLQWLENGGELKPAQPVMPLDPARSRKLPAAESMGQQPKE